MPGRGFLGSEGHSTDQVCRCRWANVQVFDGQCLVPEKGLFVVGSLLWPWGRGGTFSLGREGGRERTVLLVS